MYHYMQQLSVGALLLVLLVCLHVRVDAMCDHPIYCKGPVLEAVQMSGIFNDSKTFVDLPSKAPPAEIIAAFNKLPQNASLLDFVNQYFYSGETGVVSVVPEDWDPNPELFQYIKDPQVLEFANVINSKWLHLVRIFNDSFCDGCYSHISVPNPFVIAGSRFREYYYWDTYWALDGLLLTDMSKTALGIIQNFLGIVKQYGFIPNGGRIYYLNRSQPPMLTQMVKLYYANVPDNALLEEALPILEAEYYYWMSNHSVQLDNNAVLNRYNVNNTYPRPESFLQDVTTAQGLSFEQQQALFRELASTAETGWDFSTRWMTDPPQLTSLVTTSIIPIDLNCIMYANELTIADLYEQINQPEKSVRYRIAAANRLAAIQAYLWNGTTLSWNDYNFVTRTQNTNFYASQLVPFWAGVYQVLPHNAISAVIKNLLPYFEYVAGVPTSVGPSGQQWDFPNGWAPLQYFAVEGFFNVLTNPYWDDPVIRGEVEAMSKQLAQKWITTNYCAYKKFNLIFEKYDVTTVGAYGGGGEYTVQDGFGWTNGVALRFIAQYADTLTMGSCSSSKQD